MYRSVIYKAGAVFIAAALSISMLAACGGASSSSGSSASASQTDASGEEAQTETGSQGSPESGLLLPKGAYDISGDELVFADIEIADYGTISVALDKTIAPITVENFVSLAEDGFYDGLTFHRIMDGFMMQGGDPEGNGSGGSGTTIKGEFSQNGVENPITHVAGAISMARAKNPDSASSQFFIVQSDSTYLNGSYAAFGYVIAGQDVVDMVCSDAKPVDRNGTIKADEQPVITKITIR